MPLIPRPPMPRAAQEEGHGHPAPGGLLSAQPLRSGGKHRPGGPQVQSSRDGPLAAPQHCPWRWVPGKPPPGATDLSGPTALSPAPAPAPAPPRRRSGSEGPVRSWACCPRGSRCPRAPSGRERLRPAPPRALPSRRARPPGAESGAELRMQPVLSHPQAPRVSLQRGARRAAGFALPRCWLCFCAL